jgi:ribonuclease HII
VIAQPTMIETWIAAGVKDSKKIAETQIIKLDQLIRATHGAVVETCVCGMPKYNELMGRPGANLNRLLAWQHATALARALAQKRVAWGLLDQFTEAPLVQRELVRLGVKDFDLKMRTKAEEDPVVAAASVVARAEFVRQMHGLSRRFGAKLQKGAGPLVKEQAGELIRRFGARQLGNLPSFTSGRPTRSWPPPGNWTSCPCPSPRRRWSGERASRPALARSIVPMPKRCQLRAFDLKRIEGVSGLIGVDEAGRGALAGPVVAGAVLVTREFLEGRWALTRGGRVNDSKLLTAPEREGLWEEFEALMAGAQIHAHFGVASVEEIERFNILGATKLAMRRALEGIYPPDAFERKTEPDLFSSFEERTAFTPTVSCRILIDGLSLRSFPYPHAGVVNGDARSLCVAMASVVAKVTRDRLMRELDLRAPGYGFAQHKGYGTDEHRAALLRLGRSVHHRDLFLRKLLAGRIDPGQIDLFAPAGPP